MENLVTLTCPNCGAVTTSDQNCDYCGSLLIRLLKKGIQIENSDYKDNSKVFPELIDKLKHHLELQKASEYKDCFWMTVSNTGGRSFCRIENTPINTFSESDKKKGNLKIRMWFDGNSLLLPKFMNLDIFELFNGDRNVIARENKVYNYTLDLEEDVEGAARLISKVWNEVYRLDYGMRLSYLCVNKTVLSRETEEGNRRHQEALRKKEWLDYWWIPVIVISALIMLKNCA